MQITGMLWGRKLLDLVEFTHSEVRGPELSVDEIKDMIKRHGQIFIKPVFKGGVGKKGKSGLLGRVDNITDALKEKERLYFAEHVDGFNKVKSDGVTYEGGVPADYEVYFSITESTEYRSPVMTITHHGGVDIEELDPSKLAVVPFDPLTGLKAFHVSNALMDLGAPPQVISPLVQNLPKLWDLYNNYGMLMLELNPIRMQPGKGGRLTPVACDFKCAFDQDDPA